MFGAADISCRVGNEVLGDSRVQGSVAVASDAEGRGGAEGFAPPIVRDTDVSRNQFRKQASEVKCRAECERRATLLWEHIGRAEPLLVDVEWMMSTWVGRKNFDRKKVNPDGGKVLSQHVFWADCPAHWWVVGKCGDTTVSVHGKGVEQVCGCGRASWV